VFNIEAMGASSTGRYRCGPSHDCGNEVSVLSAYYSAVLLLNAIVQFQIHGL
jgi:hypothetical protein